MEVQINDAEARYDYYRLCRVHLETDEHVRIFQELETRSDSFTFYGHARSPNQKLTIMVAAHKIAEYQDIVTRYNVHHEILANNMQEKIEAEKRTIKPKTTPAQEFCWTNYFHLDTINAWLRMLADKHHECVSLVTLDGTSYEGRQIIGVKLSRRQGNPTIFVEGGIHAREWISPAVATYILNQLLTSTDPDIVDLATNFNWYIFPTVNPDGYTYTFDHDRLWRKSRQPHGLFRGADLNRNFDINWNGDGASADSASYDYAGSAAFSEPEAKLVADFIKTNNISTYIALHSYSQMVMFPFGHTPQPVSNYTDLKQIVTKAAAAIKAVHGKVYVSGSKHETIYPSSGGSIDWAYAAAKIPVSVTFELRGASDSRDMFILPANEITPTGEETLAAFVAILREARQLGYYK